MIATPFVGRPYFKMNGLGNEILVLDLRGVPFSIKAPQVKSLSRAKELGFDQLMAIYDPKTSQTDAFVEIFNGDGTRVRACGNGTRCVAWMLYQSIPKNQSIYLETEAGILTCTRQSEYVYRVDMGEPLLDWRDIPLARACDTRSIPFFDLAIPLINLPKGTPPLPSAVAVNMGNPHLIFFVSDLTAFSAGHLGPIFEKSPLLPERANISFAVIETGKRIHLRVWERGAGVTLACGTAACATLVAGVRKGLCEREAEIVLLGGSLQVTWDATTNHVFKTGPVELEARGDLTREMLEIPAS